MPKRLKKGEGEAVTISLVKLEGESWVENLCDRFGGASVNNTVESIHNSKIIYEQIKPFIASGRASIVCWRDGGKTRKLTNKSHNGCNPVHSEAGLRGMSHRVLNMQNDILGCSYLWLCQSCPTLFQGTRICKTVPFIFTFPKWHST